MLIVAALGGNVLLRRGEPADAEPSAATSRSPSTRSRSSPGSTVLW
jgi:carbamate kinase